MHTRLFHTPLAIAAILLLALLSPHAKADGVQCQERANLGSYRSSEDIDDLFIMGTTAYAINTYESRDLLILDISDPSIIQVLGSYDMSNLGAPTSIFVSGSTAYVTNSGSGLDIIDVSDPTAPTLLGSIETPDYASSVWVEGSTAYVGYGSGFKIIDVSDPTAPVELSSVTGFVPDLTVVGTTLYAAGNGLQIYDVSDPTSPTNIGEYQTGSGTWTVKVSGTTAYLIDNTYFDSVLYLIDISDPTAPTLLSIYDPAEKVKNVSVGWTTAYVGIDNQGVRMLDVSQPDSPLLIGEYQSGGEINTMFVSDSMVAIGLDYGIKFFDITQTPSSPLFNSKSVSLNTKMIFAKGTTVYLGSGIYDVSNLASDPVLIGFMSAGLSQDIKIIGTRAYVSGLQYSYTTDDNQAIYREPQMAIFDISTPAAPTHLGTYTNLTNSWTTTHIDVEGTTAYLSKGSYGLDIVNIEDPSQPMLLSSYNTDGIHGDTYDVVVRGSNVFLATDNGMFILDVSDPASPELIGSLETAGRVRSLTVIGTTAYLSDTYNFLIYDISDPTSPVLIGSSSEPYSASEIIVIDTTAYLLSGGLRILDISDPTQPLLLSTYFSVGGSLSLSITGTTAFIIKHWLGTAFPGEGRPTFASLDTVDISDCPPCLADLTGDESADIMDVYAFIAAFTTHAPAADFTEDGVYNFFDVSEFLQAYAQGCP